MAAKDKSKDEEDYRQLRDTMYTFLYYSNKPAHTTELTLQFNNYPKKSVERALESLVERHKIVCKMNNKTKLYYLTQNIKYTIDESEYTDDVDMAQNQEVDDKLVRFLMWKNSRVNNTLRALKEESAELDRQISGYECEMTSDELIRDIKKMRASLSSYGEVDTESCVPQEEFQKTEKRLAELQKERQKRQKLFNEMVGTIADGLEMKKKELLENSGIDE